MYSITAVNERLPAGQGRIKEKWNSNIHEHWFNSFSLFFTDFDSINYFLLIEFQQAKEKINKLSFSDTDSVQGKSFLISISIVKLYSFILNRHYNCFDSLINRPLHLLPFIFSDWIIFHMKHWITMNSNDKSFYCFEKKLLSFATGMLANNPILIVGLLSFSLFFLNIFYFYFLYLNCVSSSSNTRMYS